MTIAPEDRRELWSVAHELADVAAQKCLPLFRNPDLRAANKAADGYDPVTAADREAETAMRAVLAERRPDDSIFGEELGYKQGTSGLTWVLDPIDGTRAFICGTPSWGVLVALNAGGAPVLGLIDQPHIGERFSGGHGEARYTRRSGETRALAVRRCGALSEAVLFSTYPEVGTEQERAAFDAVREQVRLTRYSHDCYAYGLLAMGQVDLVIEAGLQPYDVQAPQAVVEAAGGIVTDWRGGPAQHGGRIIAAGDPALHAAAIEYLSRSGG